MTPATLTRRILTEKPFSKKYFEQQLNSFNVPIYEGEDVTVTKMKIKDGRYNGYLYRDWVTDMPEVPVFKINGRTIMSLTPMEIESHYMPILLAKGKVGVGGLGLGYYVQQILDKPEVTEIHVYETNKEVIELYNRNFGSHPKLTIHQFNAKLLQKEEFDFFYMDIYDTAGDYHALEDMATLIEHNEFKQYHFWTMEAFILALTEENHYVPKSWEIYIPFLLNLIEEKRGLVESWLDGDTVKEEIMEVDLF